MITVGSLFTGLGGLDRAVEHHYGARTVWTSDISKGARKIIAHRFPDAPNLGDITEVDWANVPPVDIITGGSPCQDLSHAGRRQGMTDGTRSNLWAQMREAIRVIRPSVVVWENVAGSLSARADSGMEPCPGCVGDGDSRPVLRALGRVLGDLADLGFDAEWEGLRASDIGAPHRRFRVFVVATHPDRAARHQRRIATPGQAEGWRAFADTGRSDRAPVALLPTPSVADGMGGHLNRSGARSGELLLPGVALQLLPTPNASVSQDGESFETWDARRQVAAAKHGNNGIGMPLTIAVQLLPTPNAVDGSSGHTYNNRGELLLPGVVLQLLPTPTATDRKASGGKVGGSDVTLTDAIVRQVRPWAQYADAIHRWERILRSAPDPTEPNSKGGRRLSARFTEWMMGCPDGWVTNVPGITRNECLEALGNGVVEQQALEALRRIAFREQVAA